MKTYSLVQEGAITPEMEDIVMISNETLPSEILSAGQCGEKCPENSADHRGACYLDFGHSSNHKCSVDGHEW